MRGAVLAVGDELLLGDVVNSNAAWLGKQLAAAGVQVVGSAMVGDDLPSLTAALRHWLTQADVVLLCGGLGPTMDDRTRLAVAEVAGVPLVRQPALERRLEEQFASYGFAMPPVVLVQADVPVGADTLENPVGTAPGLWLELGEQLVIALPGPPHEMRAVGELAFARLDTGAVVTTPTVHVTGLGESQVAERVEAVVTLPEGVTPSYLAGNAAVRVRFTTAGDPSVLEPLVAAVDAELGDHVWGHDDDTLEGVVQQLLGEQTVAVAESLTGGLLGARLSERPGSSATFRGSLVVYASDLKATLAGVPEDVLRSDGAVSEQTARLLAEGARTRLGADWGLSVTGVAGPDPQEDKPVGTVHVGVAGPDGTTASVVRLPGDRERVRALATTVALDALRRRLVGKQSAH